MPDWNKIGKALGAFSTAAAGGLAVPAVAAWKSWVPPYFPGIWLITSALSVASAVFVYLSFRKKSPSKGLGLAMITLGVIFYLSYGACYKSFTATNKNNTEQTLQIGFRLADFSLNEDPAERALIKQYGSPEAALDGHGWSDESASRIWKPETRIATAIIMIIIFILSAVLWSIGWTIFAILWSGE